MRDDRLCRACSSADQERFAVVGVVEGGVAQAITELDDPLYWSGAYATSRTSGLNERSFVAPNARVLGMSITLSPANSSAWPLSWRRGDVRSSADRYGWEVSWRDKAPLLARAADYLDGSPRQRAASRIVDLRERATNGFRFGLRPGDPAPRDLRSRQLPNGLWRSGHAGRVIRVS